MQKPLENADINVMDTAKKVWVTPVFEIINKDVVKSGGSGKEGSSTSGS